MGFCASSIDKKKKKKKCYTALNIFLILQKRKEVRKMATNPPRGLGRVGAVKKRIQVFNPKNKRYTKINTETHRFIDQHHEANKLFKGVKKYK